jgi:CNT family concentrative nucleoside transporter
MTNNLQFLQPIVGILLILFIAVLFSERKQEIEHLEVIKGLSLQFLLCWALLKIPFFQYLFELLNAGVDSIQKASIAGTSLVFGYLGGAQLPFPEMTPGSAFILGFQALPMILVFSALSAVLYHWRILPLVVSLFAWLLGRLLKIKGPTSFATVASVFVGLVEAPLLIRPYLKNLSRAELFIVMSSGMATISGTVLVLYATFLQASVPNVSSHLLVSSIISAPGAVILGLMVIPHRKEEYAPGEIEHLRVEDQLMIDSEAKKYHSLMEAIAEGTQQGVRLFAGVASMLIVLVALVALANSMLSLLPEVMGSKITLQHLVGLLMQPLAWSMGIPWQDSALAGELMGTKLVLNEFIAYLDLSKLPMSAIDEKSRIILTYVLCGFANFGSLGIVIAGLGSMVKERQREIIEMGAKSLLVGTLSTCLSACMAAILIFGPF